KRRRPKPGSAAIAIAEQVRQRSKSATATTKPAGAIPKQIGQQREQKFSEQVEPGTGKKRAAKKSTAATGGKSESIAAQRPTANEPTIARARKRRKQTCPRYGESVRRRTRPTSLAQSATAGTTDNSR